MIFLSWGLGFHAFFVLGAGSSPFQKIPQGYARGRDGQAWNRLIHNFNNNNSTFSV